MREIDDLLDLFIYLQIRIRAPLLFLNGSIESLLSEMRFEAPGFEPITIVTNRIFLCL